MPDKVTLVLFDVDGTLISTGGKAGRALERALERTLGVSAQITGFRYSGKTDPQIVYELMALAGLARGQVAARIEEVFEAYLADLKSVLVDGAVTVLPGVHAVLDELSRRDDVRLALLTGNVQPGARIKLAAAGIESYFATGAFGSDNEDRNGLVPVALERARAEWGLGFTPERTVIVGDAEPDVACARAGGARVVAVASGWTSAAELAACRPDVLLESLADPGALDAILGVRDARR